MGKLAGDTPAELYPRASRLLLVAIIVTVLLAGTIILLVTGGVDVPEEVPGDLVYIEGDAVKQQPRRAGSLVASIADVTQAEVKADGDDILFKADVAAPLPQRLKTSALEFRWELTGDDGSDWTLSVTINEEAQASVFSDTGYGSGTVDQTMPGSLEIGDQGVTLRLLATDIEGFPSGFDWILATTLRAFRNETESPRVEDRFPDEDAIEFKR